MNKEVISLSNKELEEQLITSDFNGKEYKKECLKELINRALLESDDWLVNP